MTVTIAYIYIYIYIYIYASVGTPWLLEEDVGQEEISSLSICLSIYL